MPQVKQIYVRKGSTEQVVVLKVTDKSVTFNTVVDPARVPYVRSLKRFAANYIKA